MAKFTVSFPNLDKNGYYLLQSIQRVLTRIEKEFGSYAVSSHTDTGLFTEVTVRIYGKTESDKFVAFLSEAACCFGLKSLMYERSECCPGVATPVPGEDILSPSLIHWFGRIDRENPRTPLSHSETFLAKSIRTDIKNHGSTEVPGELSVEMVKYLKAEGLFLNVYRHKGTVATVVRTKTP